MTGLHRAAAEGFSAGAAVYESARPGYSEEAVAWLVARLGIGPGRDVLDLAAGTGKLTRQLVPSGARIIAVEPVRAMRAQLASAVPGVETVEGTAEAIPLEDESVDAVVCAQAFHWFRPGQALREIDRVLRPGGALALLWNSRVLEHPLEARLEEVLSPHRPRFPGGEDSHGQVERSELFGPLEHVRFAHEQPLSRAGVLERVASTSFVAAMSDTERRSVLDRVSQIVAEFDEPLLVPYETDVFVADRLPRTGDSARN